jgi:hypothetical protein
MLTKSCENETKNPILPTKRNKIYFSEDTERAIIRYNNSSSQAERSLIFKAELMEPLRRLAENIINTFKFSYFDDSMENVQREVVSFMIEKMGQFDQTKGRAFSYFSIVAKNYLILTNNMNWKRKKSHEKVETMDFNRNVFSELKESDVSVENREFLRMLVSFWENNIHSFFKKERDRRIADAVLEMLRKIDSLEEFNKKHLYIQIREIYPCKTQQITKIINVMRQKYVELAVEYQTRGIINTDNVHSNRFF